MRGTLVTVVCAAIGLTNGFRDAHIRSEHPALEATIAAAAAASPTVRELVRAIEASDVVAYVVVERSRMTAVAAHVSFMGAGGGRRYVRVSIDPRFSGAMFFRLLGHELQHVAEIAREPRVVDDRTLSRFYREIGFLTGGTGGAERFETDAAIAAGERVRNEIAQAAHEPAR